MAKGKHSEAEIIGALKQLEAGRRAEDVRAAGGNVVPTPTPNNPCHCDMNGVTAEQGSKLFKVQPNPSKVKQPTPNQ